MRTVRTKRPKKAPPKPKGLRIQIKGRLATKELWNCLHEAVERLSSHGISYVSGVNIYLTPADRHGNAVTPLSDGCKVENIVIHPYRSAAEEHGL